LCLVAASFVLACGKSGPKRYPVRGQVLVNDQPADGATVVFEHILPAASGGGEAASSERPQTVQAFGTVTADGSFTLRTQEGEGAPPGDYTVLISWFPP